VRYNEEEEIEASEREVLCESPLDQSDAYMKEHSDCVSLKTLGAVSPHVSDALPIFYVTKSKTFENSTYVFESENSKKIANGHKRLKLNLTFCVDTFSYQKLFYPTSYANVMVVLPKHNIFFAE
jgi:hypothetical protein